MYFLDNEPALWHTTHRDVHPEPVSTDELMDRTVRYGGAIRRSYPDAPSPAPPRLDRLFYWRRTSPTDPPQLDRRRHGDLPLMVHYLRTLREHEAKTGERLLDVFDLHYYPQADGVWGPNGSTDAETSALRIRQTRGLWDPSYVDESWIKEPVMLIPRMKAWVDEHYPGRELSIGEWSFGGEHHMSGASRRRASAASASMGSRTRSTDGPAGRLPISGRSARSGTSMAAGAASDLGLPTRASDGASPSRHGRRGSGCARRAQLSPDKARPAKIELRGARPRRRRRCSRTREARGVRPARRARRRRRRGRRDRRTLRTR